MVMVCGDPLSPQNETSLPAGQGQEGGPVSKKFDPEMLYVECAKCGQPLLWKAGDTTRILNWAGIDPAGLDESCLILSQGCPGCQPDQEAYPTQVVRLPKGETPSTSKSPEAKGGN
jgi:hypothetical protein